MANEQINKTWPTKWTAKTTYIDIDTGEIITKNIALTNYSKIKTTKYASYTNTSRTHGRIEYTIHCRSKQLQELPFTN